MKGYNLIAFLLIPPALSQALSASDMHKTSPVKAERFTDGCSRRASGQQWYSYHCPRNLGARSNSGTRAL